MQPLSDLQEVDGQDKDCRQASVPGGGCLTVSLTGLTDSPRCLLLASWFPRMLVPSASITAVVGLLIR